MQIAGSIPRWTEIAFYEVQGFFFETLYPLSNAHAVLYAIPWKFLRTFEKEIKHVSVISNLCTEIRVRLRSRLRYESLTKFVGEV